MYANTKENKVVLVKYWHGGYFGKMQRSSAEQLCRQSLGFYIAEMSLSKTAMKH